MFARRIFVVLVAAALMLPTVIECLASGTADAQSMRCCAETSCPRHQKQTCVSTTAPADNVQPIPLARTELAAPSLAPEQHSFAEPLIAAASSSGGMADAPQDSPPELYTLHLSLLI
jgi:hypothetical protein